MLSGSKFDSILKAFRNATIAGRVPATSASEHNPAARSSLKGKRKFDPGLSGLRGAASFGVVLFHATIYFGYPLKALTNTFYLGVPIFLMMSMYLLLKRLDVNGDLKHYFKRRIIRIWPIYYGTLVAFYIIFRFPFWDFVRYLFFAEYYVNPFGVFPISIFWTLQVEEAMYLFIPLIHRLKKQEKELLAVGMILTGFSYLGFISQTPAGVHPMVYFQMFLPLSLMAYGFGILVYSGRLTENLRWLAIIGIIGYFIINLLNSNNIGLPYYANFFVNNILLYSISLLGFAGFVSKPPRILGSLVFLGEESYALYAIHYALVMVFGVIGILYAVAAAFAIEYALRPREINRRLSYSYLSLFQSVFRGRRGPPK